MRLSHIPKYKIQNKNVHIFVPNGVLWDMAHVHCGICGLFFVLVQLLPATLINTTVWIMLSTSTFNKNKAKRKIRGDFILFFSPNHIF